MKNLLWFTFGIVGGFVIAHLVDKNPAGHDALAEIDARIGEFTDRIGEAYRDQESRLGQIVDDAKDAVARAADAAADSARSAE
ncbi:ATPase [Microbacterium sp. NPDC078428]|uniref:ATPase n=1 Tax=Microbacterium limosum TaxID=3079935 RepID=A0AAU0ML47_9MICO|nr:ATPase [Microbacterium sp. Y20]WOQ70811.1 ATPase [Microbacterium sp. Y20]